MKALTIVYQGKENSAVRTWGSYAVSTLEQVTAEAKRIAALDDILAVWIEDERGFPVVPFGYEREGTV